MIRLRDKDSADQSMRIRLNVLIGLPLFIMLFFLEFKMFDLLSQNFVIVLLVLAANVGVGLLLARAAWLIVDHGARGTLAHLWAGGGAPSLRGYSEQEAFEIRGEIEKAVVSYRDRIASNPADLNARLRLGSLLAKHGDYDEAEYWFLQVRIVGGTPEQESVVGNALIDLYRASGERPKLKAELARFARNNPNSEAGQLAQQHLRELTRKDADADHSA